jgi:hypothetical protein
LHSSSMIMYERMNTAHLHNEKPTPFRFILNHIKPKGCGFFLLGIHHCSFFYILLWIYCSWFFLKKNLVLNFFLEQLHLF